MKYAFLLCAVLSHAAVANVYSYRDADGNLVYTDEPAAGIDAKKVELGDALTVLPSFKVETQSSSPTQNGEQSGSWASWGDQSSDSDEALSDSDMFLPPAVDIAYPAHDEAVWSGNGELEVALELTSGLVPSHELAVLLDGRVVARGRSKQLVLRGVDRGTHSLRAEVRDSLDKTVSASEPLTVHVLRPSVINRESGLMHPSVSETVRPESAAPAESLPATE